MKKSLLTSLFFWVVVTMGLSMGCSRTPYSQTKIVGGKPLEEGNPGLYSEVALLHYDAQKCSATVIAEDLVVTAAHCVKGISDPSTLKIYFGETVQDKETHLLRDVSAFQSFRNDGDYEGLFDIAWIRFSGALPEGFRPIEVLGDPRGLVAGESVLLVGHGRNDVEGLPELGVRLKTEQIFDDPIISDWHLETSALVDAI